VDVLQPYRNWVRMGWYAAGNDFASLARSRLTLATYWYRVGRDDTYLRGLKIMVSPVRIRVPPLLKVLRTAGKVRAPAVLPEPCDIGLSIAGSSTDRISRTVVDVVISEHWCGRGMILGIACCSDRADRHFEHRPRPTRRRCLPTDLLRLDVLAGCAPVPQVSPRLRSPVPTRPTHGAHHCILGGCS
jgi:hypothetical protein